MMKLTNDGSTVVLSQDRYLALLECELKTQMLESARENCEDYEFGDYARMLFPKEDKRDAQ